MVKTIWGQVFTIDSRFKKTIRTKLRLTTILLALFLFIDFTPMGATSLFENPGGQLVGTTVLAFLKIGVGVRAAALGGTYVSIPEGASSIHWNPASGAFLHGFNMEVDHTEWFVDTRHEFAALNYMKGFSSFGCEAVALYIPSTPETDENHPFGTGNYFVFGDYLFGLSTARRLTDRFSIGLGAKYVNEILDDFTARSFALDFGALYSIGYRDMWIGVSLSNLGTSVRVEKGKEKGELFLIPSIYRIGFSGRIVKPILAAFQIEKPSDNIEVLSVGLEWIYLKLLSLRTGYRFGRGLHGKTMLPKGLSLGLGLKGGKFGYQFSLNYAITGYGYLGDIHRIGIEIGGL